MKTFTRDQILGALKTAPLPIRELYLSEESATFIDDLRHTYQLPTEVGTHIGSLTGFLVLGLMNPAEFSSELIAGGVAQPVAAQIMNDLNEKIFKPLKEKMKGGGVAPQTAGPAQKQTPPPPAYKPILGSAYTPPPKPQTPLAGPAPSAMPMQPRVVPPPPASPQTSSRGGPPSNLPTGMTAPAPMPAAPKAMAPQPDSASKGPWPAPTFQKFLSDHEEGHISVSPPPPKPPTPAPATPITPPTAMSTPPAPVAQPVRPPMPEPAPVRPPMFVQPPPPMPTTPPMPARTPFQMPNAIPPQASVPTPPSFTPSQPVPPPTSMPPKPQMPQAPIKGYAVDPYREPFDQK